MKPAPSSTIDSRFSDPEAGPTPWPDAAHVTPLIGVVSDGAMHFCTGLREQKARNLEQSSQVALPPATTPGRGVSTSSSREPPSASPTVTPSRSSPTRTRPSTAAHGTSTVGDDAFGTGEDAAAVFRIEPDKVLAFAKEPHAQTTYLWR
jgi:hypothetical protein